MTPLWWVTKDGDVECMAFFERHYTARKRRRLKQFVGPGEKEVLRTMPDVTALFAWRKFIDDCIDVRTGKPQEGVNCAIFRNESVYQSSALIRSADAIADCEWTDRRHYTYIDPTRVASGLPGACFLAAGWYYVRHRGHRVRTTTNLLILERVRQSGI